MHALSRHEEKPMIVERAHLSITPGAEGDFEAAFETARAVVARSPGFRSLRLLRGLEEPASYLLLIEWDSLADHMEGFRGSELFTQWRALVGPHFAAEPAIEHFDPIVSQ
jgi:heme-degrading monooxygenase HmoA